jgi:ketosteroid isomerase-like protein
VSGAVTSPLEEYYRALDDGDAEGAAAVFSEDTVYIRPALPGSPNAGGVEVVRGRNAVLEYFRERGKKPFRHRITSSSAEGAEWFVEGVAGMEGEAPTHVFLVHATVDDGLITRYLAAMSEAPEDFGEVV